MAGDPQRTSAYREWTEGVSSQDIPMLTAKAGQQFDLGDGAILQVIHVRADGAMLRIDYGNASFLLPVPAAYDEVITVSALSDSDGQPGGTGSAPTCRTGERDDYFASFSNFGADADIAAPGVCILSTWKGGGYNTISGTSMATRT